jgi:cytochrome c oxidase subunit 1/cytochrome c oxidase subunit I+III
MGMVSDGLPVFCRRPLVGYTVVALATVATMVLGFGVWVHHMFATGLPGVSLSFFSAASIIIAVPSAVGVFAWLATIWLGKPVFTTAFMFFASFIILFTIGGVSGYMTGSVPVDWQLTDTYFVVAHIHYVLIGINVFPVVGATYFWFPKMTGKLMDEKLGRWNFWTMFIGFNLGFFPMHVSGLLGMPRRIYTYGEGMGWDWVNLVTTVGSFLFGFGVLIFVWNVVNSYRHGPSAGDNPWDAPTLEWATTSPPPPYNFAVLPVVASRHPLWEDRLGDPNRTERSFVQAGLVLEQGREALATTPLDAEPNLILKMPGDTLVPLLLALSMTIITVGLAFVNWWIVVIGVTCVTASICAWLWPEAKLGETAVPALTGGVDG